MSGPLGPYGPVLGMAHRYAYLIAGIVMGSICLISTVTTFILANTHNDLKQRGRYLVFWNGLSATGIVTIYLMLNAFVGDFPCYILLWMDFGRTILPKSATELNILHDNSNLNDITSTIDDAAGTVARTGVVESTEKTVIEEKDSLGLVHNNSSTFRKGDRLDIVGGSSSEAALLEKGVAGSTKHESAGDTTTAGDSERDPIGVIGTQVSIPIKQRLDAPLPPIPTRSLPQLPIDTSPICHQLVVSIAPPSPVSNSPDAVTMTVVDTSGSNVTSPNNEIPQRLVQMSDAEYNNDNRFLLEERSESENAGRNHFLSKSMLMNFDREIFKEGRSCSRYLPFNQATDGRLTIFLMVFMVVPLVICLGMQFIKPSPVQIDPVSYKCGEGPVFYPIYGIMLAFLAIGCPVLTYKLWWIKDGFGIRNELLITMIIGLPGFALYFLSPIYLKKLDAGHWNHVNWLTLTIFLGQINSVVLPLIQFFMRQRPKERSTKNLLIGIFRWDSAKPYPGTPNHDISSESSSLHSHSRESSQVLSPPQAQDDSNIFDRQSVSHHNIISQGIHGFHYNETWNSSIQFSQSAITDIGHDCSHHYHRRRRGMKGFWSKYGKDADGNIIPLSQMNPRAFEYALQDQEMLAELVKFSVTVFSAENAKFLQEYEGLRRQAREYYRLITQGRTHGSKHSHQLSDASSSVMSPIEDGSFRRSDGQPRTPKKKPSILGSVAYSIHSKLSKYGASSVDNSAKANSGSHHSSSYSAQEEGTIIRNGDPGSSILKRPPVSSAIKPYGKHRHDLRGNIWRLSLQSSLRQSNVSQSSPHESVNDDTASQATAEKQSMSSPVPFSPSVSSPEPSNLHKSSELTISSLGDVAENESDQSSFSWYGRGNSGSALSYHDETPSELSSYQDTASESFGYNTGYFGGGDSDSIAGLRRGISDDMGLTSVSGMSPREHLQGCEGSSQTNKCNCPIPIPHKRAVISTTSSHDFVRSTSAPSSRSTIHSPISPRHHASAEGSPIGSLTGDGNRESSVAAYVNMKQQQQNRLNQSFSTSPFHSPSSSVSAPFTPRLPSQPQFHSSCAARASQGLIPRSASAKTILTAEDYHQQQHKDSPNSSTTSSGPLSSLSSQQQHKINVSGICSLQLEGPTTPHTQQISKITPSMTSSARVSFRRNHHHHFHHRLHHYRSEHSSRDLHSDVVMPTPSGRTPVPKALMAAYWEIYQTFIVPNSVLELNLNECHVNEVKRLFANNECYLEMYEPIVKEVQELIYSNVWPRFIRSIQRQPQGFPGKFKRTWNAFFSKDPEDHGDGIFDGRTKIGRLSEYQNGHEDQLGHTRQKDGEDHGGLEGEENVVMTEEMSKKNITTKDYLPSPPPPQASHIHGQFTYLGGSEVPGLEGLTSSAGDIYRNNSVDQQLDLGRFGVMQDLDLSALQRIVVDPK
ncbi:hypothetical protein FBU30_003750 [Linnemannia zychae]|nr:hypothetical protein FBU30_003750 [Linnemannia zychae]